MKRLFIVLLLVLPLAPVVAQGKKDKNAKKAAPVRESLSDYLTQARKQAQTDGQLSEGSLFRPGSSFLSLAPDYKARNVNDLLVIRIVEQTSTQSSGSAKSARTFSASSSLTNIPIGKIGASSTLQNLFTPKSASALDGSAATTSTSQLNTSLTGRVIEVLPNGVMVVEAVRELDMNNEHQTLILRGLVRPGDVATDNSVASTLLSNLEISLKGKGVISDGTRPPNKIVSMLLKIVGF